MTFMSNAFVPSFGGGKKLPWYKNTHSTQNSSRAASSRTTPSGGASQQVRTPATTSLTPPNKATGQTTDRRFESRFNPDELGARLLDPSVVDARNARFPSRAATRLHSPVSSTSATPFSPGTISPSSTRRSAQSSAPTSYRPSGNQTPAKK